jgi:anti-sigma factor RsiW
MTSRHPSTEEIIDYVHHELSPSQDAELFEHFATCDACRREYEGELRLSGALRAAAAVEQLELPPTVKVQVWNRVRSYERPRWPIPLRPLIALPIAAAVAVAALFAAQPGIVTGVHPMVGAQYYFDLHSAAIRQENPLSDRSAPVLNVIETSNLEATDGSTPLVDSASLDDGPNR